MDPCSRKPHDSNLLEDYIAPVRSLSFYSNIMNSRLCLYFRPQMNLTKGRNVIFFEAAYFYDDGGPEDNYTSSSNKSVQISEIKITGELLFIQLFFL